MKLFLQSFFFLKIIIIFFPFNQLHKSIEANNYQECRKPFICGNLSLHYPFYNEHQNRPAFCGYPGFELVCSDADAHQLPEISSVTTSMSDKYYLLNMNSTSHTISVLQEDLWSDYPNCHEISYNYNSLNSNLFNYTPSVEFVTLSYECHPGSRLPGTPFTCTTSNDTLDGYFTINSNINNIPLSSCKSILFPVNRPAAAITDINSLHTAFRNGFELERVAENRLCGDCITSGGVCGHNTTRNRFTCYCNDDLPHDYNCSGPTGHEHNSNINDDNNFFIPGHKHILTKSKIIILASFSGTGIGICILSVLILSFKRRNSLKRRQYVEAFLKKHGSPGPKRYTYKELKKITNSFKVKLGEGGYGVVYQGKLHNGKLVAVKILKKSSKGDKDMEEFINEVASIGETNHKNIVKLQGFCYEGQKRALLYDYMPNGSLEKFTYGVGQKNDQPLSWEKLFEIAVGIARGLEYLHQGCNTRILHFDIKPQNILLDEKFCPKISDFGLAKSCLQKDSLISMSEARGTVGYIAPEVFFKSYGGVSHKSDVYSYGMLVLEMVGCRNNADAKVERSSEQYFPHWIYKQLEEVEELNYEEISNGEEGSILKRKMILVSLWCIQTSPLSRPNMTKVVEMLEGTLESLQIPPMPSLASPRRSQQNSSITATISIGNLFQE